MIKALISVIVPIYNVEQYLQKCVDSILNQTYKNIEVILVDDGSPDNCGKICDEYASIDSRIKVIHKENGGLSDARNAGIDNSKGDYICFIDSDDYIAPVYLERLYQTIVRDNSDMVVCGYSVVDECSNKLPQENHYVNALVNADNYFYNEFHGTWLVVAWNKLYKRNLFDNVRYRKGKIHEDEFIIHYIFYKCDNISLINEELYFYVKRENSITSKTNSVKHLDCVEALIDRCKFFIANKKDQYVARTFNFASSCLFLKKYNADVYVSERYKMLTAECFKLYKIIYRKLSLRDNIKFIIRYLYKRNRW